jgi:hypothetical protein
MSFRSFATAVLALVALTATGCSANVEPGAGASPGPVAAGVEVFPAGAVADYQLGGAYPPPAGVAVVSRDSSEEPAPGLYSICYVNGFQTQPDADWPDDLVLHDASGEPVIDPAWPDETLLAIGSAATRERIAERLKSTVDGCASAGFRAVEFDNLDSFTRSGGLLDQADAVAFATRLVGLAHDAGLAAGQKNTPQLGADAREVIGFDFAVAEECDQFDECADYTAVYGDAVIDIEYTDELRRPFEEVCADAATPRSTILRDRDLVPAGADGYRFAHC